MADAFTHAIDLQARLNLIADDSFKTTIETIARNIAESVYTGVEFKGTYNQAKDLSDRMIGPDGTPTKSKEDGDKKKDTQSLLKATELTARGTQALATGGMNILKSAFGILSDVFERIKSASPLLQAVETLFNLAMQLFFMPLGTKLATVLIPRVTELVDGVMQIWEGFEDKSLSEILADTIRIGADVFGTFFQDIGKDLASQGGILGAIGSALEMLGNFIENDGETVIEVITNIMKFIIENLPAILGTIITLFGLSLTFQAAQIAATIATAVAAGSHTPWGAVATTAAIGAVASITAGAYAGSRIALADGGYVPATPGGVPALLAEGGEGEYVVPESKKNAFAGSVLGGGAGNTFNIYVNGYTDTDLENKIVRVINEQTNLSRLRSGY